jgi:long-chain acyl-CoA synthetase
MAGSFPELLERDETRRLIAAELDRYSKDFKGYERVKKFALLPEEFTTSNGFLTPKLSLKRRVVMERYGELLHSLWR